MSTSPEVFESQMEWLRQSGIQVLEPAEVIDRLASRNDLPRNSVCLTFDDGLAGVYQHAYPVLRKFHFPALFFLVTGYLGRDNNWPGQPASFQGLQMATWQQISEMDAGGITIGAHTVNHVRLDRISLDQVVREMLEANEAITSCIGKAVQWFAYPYGRYTPSIVEQVQNIYRGACSTRLDRIYADSDPFLLPRIDTNYLLNPYAFRLLNTRAFPAYLAVRRILRSAASLAYDRAWQ